MFALICKPTVIVDHVMGENILEPSKCKLIQYKCLSKFDKPCLFQLMEAPSPFIEPKLDSNSSQSSVFR